MENNISDNRSLGGIMVCLNVDIDDEPPSASEALDRDAVAAASDATGLNATDLDELPPAAAAAAEGLDAEDSYERLDDDDARAGAEEGLVDADLDERLDEDDAAAEELDAIAAGAMDAGAGPNPAAGICEESSLDLDVGERLREDDSRTEGLSEESGTACLLLAPISSGNERATPETFCDVSLLLLLDENTLVSLPPRSMSLVKV